MKKEPHKRNSFRLLAMHLIQSGKSLVEVSKIVQVHWQTVQSWLKRFGEDGFNGIYESQRSGAPRKINSSKEKMISDKINILSESKTGVILQGRNCNKFYQMNTVLIAV